MNYKVGIIIAILFLLILTGVDKKILLTWVLLCCWAADNETLIAGGTSFIAVPSKIDKKGSSHIRDYYDRFNRKLESHGWDHASKRGNSPVGYVESYNKYKYRKKTLQSKGDPSSLKFRNKKKLYELVSPYVRNKYFMEQHHIDRKNLNQYRKYLDGKTHWAFKQVDGFGGAGMSVISTFDDLTRCLDDVVPTFSKKLNKKIKKTVSDI